MLGAVNNLVGQIRLTDDITPGTASGWTAKFAMILARSVLSTGVPWYARRPQAIASLRAAGSPAAVNRLLRQVARFPRQRVHVRCLPERRRPRAYTPLSPSQACQEPSAIHIRSGSSARAPCASPLSQAAERSEAECAQLPPDLPTPDNARYPGCRGILSRSRELWNSP